MIADASNFVGMVDSTFFILVAICVFFLVLITTLMIVFVVKYSRKKNPKATNIHGSVPLEITWTVIPTLIVLVMFWLGWTGYVQMATPPKDAMVVDVYAQMWKWSFKYSNGKEADSLYLPVNKPVLFNLHSKDVDHSFFVPAFKIKKDVIPNRTNHEWFKPEQTGVYDIFCAEYCGLRHSYMLSKVVVMPMNDFLAWANKGVQVTDSLEVLKSTKTVINNQPQFPLKY